MESFNSNIKNKWNKLAIVGFGLSIIGFFMPILDIGSIVLGIIALRQIKKTKDRGKILAILSIVFSFYFILILISGYLVYLRTKYGS